MDIAMRSRSSRDAATTGTANKRRGSSARRASSIAPSRSFRVWTARTDLVRQHLDEALERARREEPPEPAADHDRSEDDERGDARRRCGALAEAHWVLAQEAPAEDAYELTLDRHPEDPRHASRRDRARLGRAVLRELVVRDRGDDPEVRRKLSGVVERSELG